MSHEKAGLVLATLFLARDLAHREHLATKGPGAFAKHEALGEFYTGIIDLADTLAEGYMGRFDVDLDIPLLANESQDDIVDTLTAQVEWIRENRRAAIASEETPLHNIVDEIELRYYRTLFKLRRLQ